MAVTLDITDGAGGRKTTDGWEFERIAVVTGVTGDGHAKIYSASLATGMPDIGYPHPTVTSCILQSIDTIYVDLDQVKFRLTYKQGTAESSPGGFEADSISVGASVIQVETNKDIAGNEFVLTYEYPIGYQRSPHDTALTVAAETTQGAMASKLQPQRTLIIQKLLGFNPEGLAETYVGKINSVAWRGNAVKTWICTRIQGYSSDGGNFYKTTFEFQYKPETWNPTLVFIKDDGKPPAVTDGNSEKSYVIYSSVDFNNLNL